jgi:hypothetical protein
MWDALPSLSRVGRSHPLRQPICTIETQVLKQLLNQKGWCEMEERVKRLELSNRILGVLVAVTLVLLVFVGVPKVRDFFSGGGWLINKGVVTDGLTTKIFTLMELNTSSSKPRAILMSAGSGTALSMIDSTGQTSLEIGIKKDPKLGELPYISFHTKAGLQVLEPDAEGKVTWVTFPNE